jgi:hypothetical protein
MSLKCPKCGHPRPGAAAIDVASCPACGLVFAKWAQRVLGQERLRTAAEGANEESPRIARVVALLLPAPDQRTDQVVFWGRCALYIAFLAWGIYFISLDLKTNEIGQSFMHRVNLIFHEAGHVIFMPFGHFMMVLGGTLGQLLMPATAGVALLVKNRDPFGASLALWWFAQSMMDLAPYINDARDLQLMLLGGGTGEDRPGMHDWENILLDLGLIHRERAIALGAERVGELLMITAFVWGALVLKRHYDANEAGATDV